MIRALIALRDFLHLLRDFLIRLEKNHQERKARKAVKDSSTGKTQRPLEDHISGTSGRPSRHKYNGMSTRPRKPRD